ncbi:hypothetical protein EVAR_67855_1 [Eumeta japonica]|uniref:Pleiotrophin/Midkine C-terminal domain-containing protein n=1 Tax=Eumeta variegata TaxID=151549 RepID=A0A4C1SI56_EUMVA|nr:hypothetical protein EVAR_67855_1 [Eumeta japonica]
MNTPFCKSNHFRQIYTPMECKRINGNTKWTCIKWAPSSTPNLCLNLNCNKFGFTRGRSTIDAGVELVEKIFEAWEDSRNAIGVFCDLSKAFDCVNHETLIRKLHHYGVTGRALDLLASYLTNSLMSYGILLWGHAADVHRIFVLQKRPFAQFTGWDLVFFLEVEMSVDKSCSFPSFSLALQNSEPFAAVEIARYRASSRFTRMPRTVCTHLGYEYYILVVSRRFWWAFWVMRVNKKPVKCVSNHAQSCRYEKSSWSECSPNGEMSRTDVLKANSDPTCDQSRRVTKKCNKNKQVKATKDKAKGLKGGMSYYSFVSSCSMTFICLFLKTSGTATVEVHMRMVGLAVTSQDAVGRRREQDMLLFRHSYIKNEKGHIFSTPHSSNKPHFSSVHKWELTHNYLNNVSLCSHTSVGPDLLHCGMYIERTTSAQRRKAK